MNQHCEKCFQTGTPRYGSLAHTQHNANSILPAPPSPSIVAVVSSTHTISTTIVHQWSSPPFWFYRLLQPHKPSAAGTAPRFAPARILHWQNATQTMLPKIYAPFVFWAQMGIVVRLKLLLLKSAMTALPPRSVQAIAPLRGRPIRSVLWRMNVAKRATWLLTEKGMCFWNRGKGLVLSLGFRSI